MPKDFKGIFPLQIISYRIPTKILQTKGGPKPTIASGYALLVFLQKRPSVSEKLIRRPT